MDDHTAELLQKSTIEVTAASLITAAPRLGSPRLGIVPAAFEITVFTKSGGPLTKRIQLADDGTLVVDGNACVMTNGKARREKIANIGQLAELIDNLKSIEALALGTLRAGLPDDVWIKTKTAIGRRAWPDDVIARTKENFEFRKGHAALALFDFDTKGMPQTVADRLAALGGFWPALASILPDLDGCAHIVRKSTSAGLSRKDTGQQFPGSGGLHGYVLVKDGTDVERFLTTLHDRCWLAGLGWLMAGKGGQELERSIIDRMVGSPERLVFEGKPILKPPLQQDAASRRCSVTDGDALDTIAACKPLTSSEQQRLRELRAEEAQRIAPEIRRVREELIAELIARTGLSPHDAARVIEQQSAGVLLPDVVLPFDDNKLKGTTVRDVLDDPAKFEGCTLADPLEGIEYGRCKAKVMRRADGTPFIHSFAHGKTIYELRRDADREEAAEPTLLERMNAKYCVLPIAGKVRIVTWEKAPRLRGGEREVMTLFMASDFKLMLNNRKVQVSDDETEGLGTWWLMQRNRQQYKGLVFCPGQPPIIDGYKNLWRGWGVTPAPGSWPLMKKHIKEVLAAGVVKHADYIENWSAWSFQHPAEPAEVALGFQGGRGTGKGIYGRSMAKAFGQHGLHISSMQQMAGRFNRHLLDCALLFADEAYWPGDKSAEGTLKRLITEDTLTIEPKNVDIFQVENALHIIMAANEEWVVPAGIDERRFAMFEVSELHKGDKAYFTPLYAELANGGLAAMMYDLLAKDLQGWHPREDVPQTPALMKQKIATFDTKQTWWHDTLRRGTLPLAIKDKDKDKDTGLFKCQTCSIYDNYVERIDRSGIRRKAVETELGMFLSKMLEGTTFLKTRGSYLFPSLKTCRERFDAVMRSQVAWDDPHGEWQAVPDKPL